MSKLEVTTVVPLPDSGQYLEGHVRTITFQAVATENGYRVTVWNRAKMAAEGRSSCLPEALRRALKKLARRLREDAQAVDMARLTAIENAYDITKNFDKKEGE